MKKLLISLVLLNFGFTSYASTTYCPNTISCTSTDCSIADGWKLLDKQPIDTTSSIVFYWDQAVARHNGAGYEVSCVFSTSEQPNTLVVIEPDGTQLSPDKEYSSNKWVDVSSIKGSLCSKNHGASDEKDCPFTS